MHLRRLQVEPPPPERLRRLLGTAIRQREEHLCLATFGQLASTARDALDALIHTDTLEEEAGQAPLFPVKSDLAILKDGAGAVKVVTVCQEIEKLQQLRALGLPKTLFEGVPDKIFHALSPACERRAATGTPPPPAARALDAARRLMLATAA